MTKDTLGGGRGHTDFGLPDHNRLIESDTGLRYSLSNRIIGSTDRIIPHPSGKLRVVEYPDHGLYRRKMREKLLTHNLIIGNLFSDDVGEVAFTIPLSARPIGYEASQTAVGEYTYNDQKLFNDLGRLFKELALINEQDFLVVRETIGSAVAIVEFGQSHERHIGFVPGVEEIIYPLRSLDDVLTHYTQQLGREFGYTFEMARKSFEDGFSGATNDVQG